MEEWQQKDPITRFRVFLAKHDLWDEEFEKECVETSREDIAAAVKAAEEAGPPAVDTIFEQVYAETPVELELQREGLHRLIKSGGLTGKDEGYFPL